MTMCCRKAQKKFCAASISTGNRTGTCVAQKSTRSSFAALNSFFSHGTTLKSMKLSCNTASSTANVCDNVWQIAGSAVKEAANVFDSSEVSELSTECGLQAFKHISKYPLGVCNTFIVFTTEFSGGLEVQKIATFCMNFE